MAHKNKPIEGSSRKTMKKILICSIFVLICSSVYSIPGFPSEGESVLSISAYVQGFYQRPDGSFYTILDMDRAPEYDKTSNVAVKSLTAQSGFILFPKEMEGRKSMLAQLMFAKAMDMKVRFRLYGEDTSLPHNANTVSYILVPFK